MPQSIAIRSTTQHAVRDFLPSDVGLAQYHEQRYGDVSNHGWRVQLRHRFGYYMPDLVYQYLLDNLITSDTDWIDVGGGKSIFPDNERLSLELAERCNSLVGVDPSDNIHANDLVDVGVQSLIEDFDARGQQFDLATFRMVAEHIPNPQATVAALDRLLRPGGYAVIYTPYKWSPVAIIAALTPFWLHPPLVKLLSGTSEEDVFPTAYKMNTRGELKDLFHLAEFAEVGFEYLDNTATFQRFKPLLWAELTLRNSFRAFGLAYPENAILGVYQKPEA